MSESSEIKFDSLSQFDDELTIKEIMLTLLS